MSTKHVRTQDKTPDTVAGSRERPIVSEVSVGPQQRIDPAHPPAREISEAKSEAAAPRAGMSDVMISTPSNTPDDAANLRWQAAQLAEQLQQQQEDLDNRKEEFNADLTRFEAIQRQSRAEAVDRERLLTAREEELDRRARALAEQLAAAAAAEAGADREHHRFSTVLSEREQKLDQLEAKLKQQQQSLTAQQRALIDSSRRWQSQRDELDRTAEQKSNAERQRIANLKATLKKTIREAENRNQELQETQKQTARLQRLANQEREAGANAKLAKQQTALQTAETLIAKRQAELDRQQETLRIDRQNWQQQMHQDKLKSDQESKQQERTWAQRVESLSTWEKTLSSRYEAAQQLRDEALELQRDGLEMRLVAEQLWAHLVDVVPADERTRTVSKIRQRLTDSHRHILEEVAELKQELVALSDRLETRRANLSKQKADLQQWLEHRQQELDEDATRLMDRSRVLDLREGELESMAQNIVQERLQYEDRLREQSRKVA